MNIWCYIYRVEYQILVEINKLQGHETTWININNVLSEKAQSPKYLRSVYKIKATKTKICF